MRGKVSGFKWEVSHRVLVFVLAGLCVVGPGMSARAQDAAGSAREGLEASTSYSGDWRNYQFQLIRDPGPQTVSLFNVQSPLIKAKACNFDLKSFLVAYARWNEIKTLFLDYPTKLLFLAMFAAYSLIPIVPGIIDKVNQWSNMAANFAMADCQQMAQFAAHSMSQADSGTFARRLGCRMNSNLAPEKQLTTTACDWGGDWGGELGWEFETNLAVGKFVKGPSDFVGSALHGAEQWDACKTAKTACSDEYTACRKDKAKTLGDCQGELETCTGGTTAAGCRKEAAAIEEFFGGMVGTAQVDVGAETYSLGKTGAVAPAVIEMVRMFTEAAGKALAGAVAKLGSSDENRVGNTESYLSADSFLSKTPVGMVTPVSVISVMEYHCRGRSAEDLARWPISGGCGWAIEAVARVYALEATLITINKALEEGKKVAVEYAATSSRQDVSKDLFGAIHRAEDALAAEFGYGKGAFDPTLKNVLAMLSAREIQAERNRTDRIGDVPQPGPGQRGPTADETRRRSQKSTPIGQALRGLSCEMVWVPREVRE